MATDEALTALPPEYHPNIDHLITEDGAPVDGLFSEKQMRLLTEPLLSCWPGPGEGRAFVVMANVGLFYALKKPPFVPDVMLSVDVDYPDNLHPKSSRSYFSWEYGKMPEVVIEIVSNREGGEDTVKLAGYARLAIEYYVIFDPEYLLSDELLRCYGLVGRKYQRISEPFTFPELGLGLELWHGRFERSEETWLRWADANGNIIPTGIERAEAETQRAEAEHERAEAERARADAQSARAERLAEKLRQLGIEPNGQNNA
jgi:hypothetical protein